MNTKRKRKKSLLRARHIFLTMFIPLSWNDEALNTVYNYILESCVGNFPVVNGFLIQSNVIKGVRQGRGGSSVGFQAQHTVVYVLCIVRVDYPEHSGSPLGVTCSIRAGKQYQLARAATKGGRFPRPP